MVGSCRVIPKPRSFKELLELFSRLKDDIHTVEKLQNMLDMYPEVKEALKEDGKSSVQGSHWTLKMILYKVENVYPKLENDVSNGRYKSFVFSSCDTDVLLGVIHESIRSLYIIAQFLYSHLNTPGQLGLEDWAEQDSNNETFHKWLTDGDHNLDVGLDMLPRGLTANDIVKGPIAMISVKLVQIYTIYDRYMKGLFLYKPWQPGKVGDMFAFLKQFCTKMNDKGFSIAFTSKNGVDSEMLNAKAQVVLTDMASFNWGLTPMNEEIYSKLSERHMTIYLEILLKIIPLLMDGLAGMGVDMNAWNSNGSGADRSVNVSRFYYGFKGGEWHRHEQSIKSSIKKLAGKEGSLSQLYGVLHVGVAGKVVGGLLGAGAAVGVGGAAYAGNLFGFGDMVRGTFSGVVSAANNLRK